MPPHKRDVNTVFQSYALFPHMTVEKNVAFGLERRKVPKADVKRRVAETLDLVELGPLAKRRPTQMSGGQQQRVALARALVNRPRRCCSTSRSARSTCACASSCRSSSSHIQREVGITFVHVTHDQEEAMTMADTIAVMNDGRIDQLGVARPTSTTARRPSSSPTSSARRTCSTPSRAGRTADVAEFDARRRTAARAGSAVGDDAGDGIVRIGVRPEKITLQPAEDAGSADGAQRAPRPRHGRQLPRRLHAVRRAHRRWAMTSRCSRRTRGSSLETIGPGRRVAAVWDPEHTFVVAKETGNDTTAA